MAPSNYKVSTMRGANFAANVTAAMGTKADARWATGKLVKRSLGFKRFDVVMAWTCKTRDESGKVVTVRVGVTEECAKRFVETGEM